MKIHEYQAKELLRAAGVPARVVLGYQGGEWVAGSEGQP